MVPGRDDFDYNYDEDGSRMSPNTPGTPNSSGVLWALLICLVGLGILLYL
ncbi:hypothetical protein [Halosimplex sp. J119]